MALTAVVHGLEIEELLRLLALSKRSGMLYLGTGDGTEQMRFFEGDVALPDAGTAITERTTPVVDRLFRAFEDGVAEAYFTCDAAARPDEGRGENGCATAAVEPPRAVASMEDILRDLCARTDEWRAIREVVPTMGARVSLRRDGSGGSGAMSLEAEEWRVVCALGTPQTVRALAAELGLAPLATCRLVVGLAARSLIDVHPEVETPAGDAPANLLLKGVTDVLADVTAEMDGIAERQARLRNGRWPGPVDEEEMPAEWLAYYSRLQKTAGGDDVALP